MIYSRKFILYFMSNPSVHSSYFEDGLQALEILSCGLSYIKYEHEHDYYSCIVIMQTAQGWTKLTAKRKRYFN